LQISNTAHRSATKPISRCHPLAASRYLPAWMPGSIRLNSLVWRKEMHTSIRNAGGRASDDAIRSLIISYKLLGTREFFVIHHTNCGMEFFTNEVIRGLLKNSLETAELTPGGFRDVGKGPGSRAGEFIEWLTIPEQKQAVVDDVLRIRTHPLVPSSIPIYGYIYDVKSGQLIEVEAATRAGATG
jgi:carbonic anhydrase